MFAIVYSGAAQEIVCGAGKAARKDNGAIGATTAPPNVLAGAPQQIAAAVPYRPKNCAAARFTDV
jgi:hypothetical protein